MVIVSTVISYAVGLPLGLTLVVTAKGGIRPMPIVNTVLGVVVNIPVSYTHLDVYKRQLLHISESLRRGRHGYAAQRITPAITVWHALSDAEETLVSV